MAKAEQAETDNGEVSAEALQDVTPENFVALMSGVTDEQLAEMMNSEMRTQVLDEIFGRMAEHVDPAGAKDTNAVIHFKILDKPEDQGGGYDHYEIVFKDGACSLSEKPEADPNVTIKVDPVNFLKLASNQASGPTLFMTGKLKLEGDLMLASRLMGFFKIPTSQES